MTQHIDIYCERLDASFWSEPVNAVTNGAFLIAALICLWGLSYYRLRSLSAIWLIILVAVIGIGSFLFHSFATRWAMLADVLPILVFQISFLLIYSHQIIKLRWWGTAGLFLGFVGLIAIFAQLPSHWLNGSLSYAPAFIFLAGFGLYHVWQKLSQRWLLLSAAGVFAISLTFRSIDDSICHAFPLGTHFMWHILNAVVLGSAVWAFMVGQIDRYKND